ncbi:MAG: L-serine ammonia-lyase, iron-sulfur-dependent, subunit alpha [Treponema sp.]|jgi:L-serine dehydratase|nr:L-serine ammonia-lyase, iron-sulfur-dependent, subunit alpha [Treponema sp.]
MKYRFHTYAELAANLQEGNLIVEEYAVKREAFMAGIPEDAVYRELDRRIAVTRASLIKGLESPQKSRSGLTRGAAVAFARTERRLVKDRLWRRAASYALAINEVNACGGKIVSFPTAGSSGIVPGLIWAWWDSRTGPEKPEPAPAPDPDPVPPMLDPPYNPKLRGAFLVASLTGVLIAQGATLAGSEGGCQAECGGAGAMGACALAYLENRPLEECFSAAALSLKNSLGLACDPVAGLVEVPCVKRNAFVTVNALMAVDLTLAGVYSIIPFDEVVSAMKQIGDSMPAAIKENANGGLALTPTGLSFREQPDSRGSL